jgi:lactate permease
MGGWKALKGVLPGAVVCGVAFAGMQFTVSNFFSVYVTDILSSITAILALVVLLQFWKPRDSMEDDGSPVVETRQHTAGEILYAWAPYALLVVFVSLWGFDAVKFWLNKATFNLNWAGLHNLILRMPPAVSKPAPYAAVFKLDILAAAGSSCMFSAIAAALFLRMPIGKFVRVVAATAKQLAFAMVTLAAVLALAYLMNYCGATATLGLAFAATGVVFPFFSALLGWMGVFLTGSDTSANALFGNLQVVTANSLHLKPVLMAASNSAGGVMGKMISLQSIAVAAAATGMPSQDEAKLFRFTLRHSIFLATVIGLVVLFYSYVVPAWAW